MYMRTAICFFRYINSTTTRVNTTTCCLVGSILKLNFIANRVSRLLFSTDYMSNTMMEHDTKLNRMVWDPVQVFNCPAHYNYAVLILNCPIFWKHEHILRIWEKAQVTITVDGGTHRWVKYLEEKDIHVMNGEYHQYVPDLITGDMDSCSPLVIEKLKAVNATVITTPDQSYTDFTKALLQLAEYTKTKNINLSGIYVFAETSGRMDHIAGNINTLYKSEHLVGKIPVIQVASDSLTWVLKPGSHTIAIPEVLVQTRTWCGLLPIGSPVSSITTTGLMWNLNNSHMEFGGLVSTSNTYSSSEVTVHTDTAVVWTMGIEPFIESISRNGTS